MVASCKEFRTSCLAHIVIDCPQLRTTSAKKCETRLSFFVRTGSSELDTFQRKIAFSSSSSLRNFKRSFNSTFDSSQKAAEKGALWFSNVCIVCNNQIGNFDNNFRTSLSSQILERITAGSFLKFYIEQLLVWSITKTSNKASTTV